MDAVTLLENDHKEVKRMLDQYVSLPRGQPEERRALAERIIRELMVHERIEEEIFYPAFQKASQATGQGKGEVSHAKEEHLLVDTLTAQLEELDPEDPQFDATFLVMKENIEHHIKDEEEKMFPVAKKILSGQLPMLGRDMMEYKASLERELREGAQRETTSR